MRNILRCHPLVYKVKYCNVVMYMTAAGTAKSAESKRSSIPPWPGRILPESLIPRRRFSIDSKRSPHVPKITTTSARPAHTRRFSNRLSTTKTSPNSKLAMICDAPNATIAPPMLPSHDFFGERRGKSLCFPHIVPTQYAPVSLVHRKMNMLNTYIQM